MWSQGLLSPLQLVSEVLGFPPEFNLDLLLCGRGQGLNGPLDGLCCFCIPLDFVEKPGEKTLSGPRAMLEPPKRLLRLLPQARPLLLLAVVVVAQ